MNTLSLYSTSHSQSLDDLRDIRDPACSLAVWQRDALPEGLSGVAALLRDQPRDVRFAARKTDLARELPFQLAEAGFPAGETRDALIADIAALSDNFCAILDIDALEVRLEIVTGNSCRKWHADYVTARLISTYVGSGSQWLDARDADRVSRGSEPAQINQLPAGHVGLFKGRLSTQTPIIHRSPPIEGTGETRLLLVLNPVGPA